MKKEKIYEVYDALIDNKYFTEAELELVCNMYGFNLENLNRCIYCRYGYQDYEQLRHYA